VRDACNMRSEHRVVIGKPKGKNPFDRCGCSWEGNVKMDLRNCVCVCGRVHVCVRARM
jgi:hypothetical protein